MAASDDRVMKLEQGESSLTPVQEIVMEIEEEDSPPAADSHEIQSEIQQVSDPPAQGEHVVVCVFDALEEPMRNRLEQHCISNVYYFNPECPPTIRMVPDSIRKGNEGAYTPKLISIGPFHRGASAELRQVEPLKWRYLQDLIQRSSQRNSLIQYISAVREKVGDARKQYLGDFGHMSYDEFVEMLVLDGCFILEFLFKRAQGSVGFPWNHFRWNLTFLRHDLLLLENQIPFFVLEILFDNTHSIPQPENKPTLTLMDFVLHYLFKHQSAGIKIPNEKKVHHLLHLYHLGEVELLNSIRNQANQRMIRCRYYRKLLNSVSTVFFFLVSIILMWKIPSRKEKDDEVEKGKEKFPRAVPTVRKLRDAGLKFRRKTQDKMQECFLDVSFNEEDGEIAMPLLSIQNTTVSSLRNLIALEQCSIVPKEDQYFTSFAVFMDQVIDTSEDVAILYDHKVIESKLGCDEDVATLFNGICSGTTLDYDKHCLKDLFRQVKDYYESNRNRWRADLVRGYFHNPWARLSFIAAFLLLASSALQAGYTVRQSYK